MLCGVGQAVGEKVRDEEALPSTNFENAIRPLRRHVRTVIRVRLGFRAWIVVDVRDLVETCVVVVSAGGGWRSARVDKRYDFAKFRRRHEAARTKWGESFLGDIESGWKFREITLSKHTL